MCFVTRISEPVDMAPRTLSRRSFVGVLGGTLGGVLGASVGGLAGGTLLAGCGGGDSGDGNSGGGLPGGLAIVQRFPKSSLVPGTVRLPISLADATNLLVDSDELVLPGELAVTLTNMDTGDAVAAGVRATKHGINLPVPYWPVMVEVPAPGIYSLTLDDHDATSAGVQVLDRELVSIPSPGSPLPGFATPTVDDARGVQTICTRTEGTCPFHEVTLDEALGLGKPVVYLIGTPAFCQTGVCAPALEAVMAIAARVGDVATFVHADVYSDSAATTPAPAVTAYNMTYEPALFVTDADGILVSRLDGVFDEDEIAATLSRVGVS